MNEEQAREENKKRILKEAYKEALKEWLDDRYADLGRFSFSMIRAAATVALVYFILKMSGWHKVP